MNTVMTPSPRPVRSLIVAALVYDKVKNFDLAIPSEIFGVEPGCQVTPWYGYMVCAAERPPLATCQGFTIDTPHRLPDLARADLVVVPGWRDVDERPPEPMLEALRAAHRRGARILSVCTGAFVLAAAGLLDDRPATTHWTRAQTLADRYPRIDVDPRVLYVDDGEVLTSAGMAAGIDLCLHVVGTDFGAEAANMIARRLVMPPHRDGGQAQFIDRPIGATAGDGDLLGDTLAWMLEHLPEPLEVHQLARRVHLSPRTFARRFRAVTGTTPRQWLLAQRILLARRLLESSDDPVEQVADRCGLGSAGNLREHFQRAVGVGPAAYRRTFRGARLDRDGESLRCG